MAAELYIGLMSGTSVDAVDCVLARFDDSSTENGNDKSQVQLLASSSTSIPPALRQQILALCSGKGISLTDYGATDIALGRLFAEAVHSILADGGITAAEVRAIGSHGQTVFHQPRGSHPFTLQLGDPNSIAQATGITTVADFRRRDLAAGGEGAPLAPLLHRHLFAPPAQLKQASRGVLNLGGIANITLLQADGHCLAFDTGPANVLMDYWASEHINKPYDDAGTWAASGKSNPALLQAMLEEPYFRRPHPKSTGRELFNSEWLEGILAAVANGKTGSRSKSSTKDLAAKDVQATLLELTAVSISNAIKNLTDTSIATTYACGGGTHNRALMHRLQKLLSPSKLTTTADLGLPPDWVEATAFAWLAKQALSGQKQNTPPFTGAKHPIPLGAIYPG